MEDSTNAPDLENDSTATAPVAVAKYVKSPSESDSEFAERKRASEYAKPRAELNLGTRGKFQFWLDQNYRSIAFPALQQLEKLLDDNVGKISADDAKVLEAERRRLGV